MKNLALLSLVACAFALAAALPAQANTDLIISEYVEGSSNNKALEIWNHTGGPVDLTAGAYKIQIYSNGSAVPSATVSLTGVLANLDAYVVANTASVVAITSVSDLLSGSINFNGNDAVVLVKGGSNTTVDALGQIGFDPVTQWGVGLQSTADNTIRRKSSVCDGDLDGSNVYDPSIEWDGYAVDTFGDLGTHTDVCGPVPATLSTWGTVKGLYR